MATSLNSLRDTLLNAKSSAGRAAIASSDRLFKTSFQREEIHHEATKTTLTSSDDISGRGRGYRSPRVFWDGDSTARVRITGAYSGEKDRLKFTVEEDDDGQHIQVNSRSGEDLGRYAVESGERNMIRLDNGVNVRIQRGSIETGDSFNLQVFDPDGRPTPDDRRLGGAQINRMVFGDGEQVRRGRFEINDTQIRVNRHDTIDSMMRKITRSAAGVMARYDAETDSVTLTSKEAGAQDITLGEDSSGFLAAMNLEDGNLSMGQEARVEVIETNTLIEDVDLRTGEFFINDVAIEVREDDTLRDVVDRINGSEAGVIARMNRGSGQLHIRSRDRNEEMTLKDGSAGFFAATEIREGTYRTRGGGMSSSDVRAVMENLRDISGNSAAMFGEVSGERHASADLNKMRDRFTKAMDAALADTSASGRRAAKDVFGESGGEDFFNLMSGESSDLKSALRSGDEDLMTFLLGENPEEGGGLLGGLLSELAGVGESLGRMHGGSGLVINIAI